MMPSTHDDAHALAEQLAEACKKAGLNAEVLGPTRVRVSAPDASHHLTEIIRCMPDGAEELEWWWSWDEPMCPATHIADAVRIIAHVVTPPTPRTR